jgi:transitional endoplasmic reticulum ATPase
VPSALSWDALGGLETIRTTLVEEIVRAIACPEIYIRMGVRPVRGVLLYGPPGTGKTLLARIMAVQAGANFIAVRGPEILSKWVGESERFVRTLFERARQVSPCIIFFDEIDALTATRGSGTNEVGDRVVNQLLTEMDGFQASKHVCVIGATNRKDMIDPALLRPGRFDYVFEVPLPGENERKQIFQIHLHGKPIADDVRVDELAGDPCTKDLSGAHVEEICRRAAIAALREHDFHYDETRIEHRHLLAAVATVKRHAKNLESDRHIGFIQNEQ